MKNKNHKVEKDPVKQRAGTIGCIQSWKNRFHVFQNVRMLREGQSIPPELGLKYADLGYILWWRMNHRSFPSPAHKEAAERKPAER